MKLLRKIYDWIDERLNFWVVLLFLLLYLPFYLYFLPEMETRMELLAGGPVRLLDLHFGFTPEQAYAALEALGEGGREYYLQAIWTVDLAFPFCSALFMSALLILLFRKVLNPGSPWQLFAFLPCLKMVLDLLENTGISLLTRQYPDLSVGWVHLTAAVGALKWLTSGATLFILLAALVAFAIEYWKKWLPN
jgi:hypothetical protein